MCCIKVWTPRTSPNPPFAPSSSLSAAARLAPLHAASNAEYVERRARYMVTMQELAVQGAYGLTADGKSSVLAISSYSGPVPRSMSIHHTIKGSPMFMFHLLWHGGLRRTASRTNKQSAAHLR
ncbi:hypothetical protein PMIN04_009849 [Paraphaeosphaeria minitans]